jgi:ankyrin repeat protein
VLLGAGANIHTTDPGGWTALHVAMLSNRAEVCAPLFCEYLLSISNLSRADTVASGVASTGGGRRKS